LKFLLLTKGLNTLVVFQRNYVNVRAIALVDILTCNFSLWSSLLDVLCKIYVYAILHSSSALWKSIFTHLRRFGMQSHVIVIVYSVFFLLICSTEYCDMSTRCWATSC
jgi:hypothetical protein